MAKKEKELHRRLYPTWSARDNYALHAKKKRKRDNSHHDDDKGTAAEEDRGKNKRGPGSPMIEYIDDEVAFFTGLFMGVESSKISTWYIRYIAEIL